MSALFPCYDIAGRETCLQHTIISELVAQDEREILYVSTSERARCVGITTLSMNLYLAAFCNERAAMVVRVLASAVACARDVMRWVYEHAQEEGQTRERRLTVVVHLPASALKDDDNGDGAPDQ